MSTLKPGLRDVWYSDGSFIVRTVREEGVLVKGDPNSHAVSILFPPRAGEVDSGDSRIRHRVV
jgi:hypothetical protein